MSLKPEFGNSENVNLGAYYAEVASNTAAVLWRRKWLIAAFLVVFPALAFLALVLIGPRYTAETMIELGFNRTTGAAFDTKADTKTTLDASVLVDSAARLLRSRPVAGAVAIHLGLDKDPRYTRNPLLLQALAFSRSVLRFPEAKSTPHDRAVNELLRRITVSAQPRSYVISITATAEEPEHATTLVEAVVSAYLKSRILQELYAAEGEMKQDAAIYGIRHPRYQLAQTKLRHVEAELNAFDEKSKGGTKVLAGDTFMTSEVVVGPSSAQISVALGVALVVGFVCGIWTALYEATVKLHLSAILYRIRVRFGRSGESDPQPRILEIETLRREQPRRGADG
jgi:capsular polysaccharide biosynthesis protein